MSIHPSIFRAYDIRGIVDDTLFEPDAYAIGAAFASYVKQQSSADQPMTIAVGRDGRLSSPILAQQVMAGIESTGATVIDVGMGPTPLLYFAVRRKELDGGIMITGSHNPAAHNGFKMMKGKAALFGDEIQTLREMIEAKTLLQAPGGKRIEDTEIFETYVDVLCDAYRSTRAASEAHTVVWDPGNGAAGDVVKALSARLPGTHILLNETIDGTFPGHHPDPSDPKNMQELIDAIAHHNADIGLAFDGDGDRLGVVDGVGNIIWGDQLMMLFAADVLVDNPGRPIIADVKASQALFDYIADCGGKPVMWKTGHSFIKAKMAELQAPFAGEMSGHVFFADRYYGFDDGVYAAIRLLNIASALTVSLQEQVATLPIAFSTAENRVEVTEARKFAIIDEVKARLQEQSANFNDIDGVRVLSDHGWWLLRASNTQAVLVTRCEAHRQEDLPILEAALNEELRLSGV